MGRRKKSVAEQLGDISDLLLEQALNITNSDLTGDKLKEECARSSALADIAGKMIDVNKVIVSAAKVQAEYGRGGMVDGVALISHCEDDHV